MEQDELYEGGYVKIDEGILESYRILAEIKDRSVEDLIGEALKRYALYTEIG